MCSPDPLKQAAYLVKKYAADLSAMETAFNDAASLERMRYATIAELRKALEDERDAKRIAMRDADASRDTHLQNSEALMKELADYRQEASMNMTRANALKAELDRRLQERDNYRESCEKLRKENLDMRAALDEARLVMEAALSLGSPRG